MNSHSIFRSPLSAALLALTAAVAWGFAYPLIKLGFAAFGITPDLTGSKMLFAGIRFCISGFLILALAVRSGKTLTPEKIQQGTDFNLTITVGNTSGAKDYTNLALTEAIPSGWEIINDRLLGQGASKASFTYKDIRDDRVIWFFDLPKGSSKTFRMKMHASYLGELTLPAIKCEAMYDPHIVANTASSTAKVTE